MDSGSDEESTNKTQMSPDSLTLLPTELKKKRGGQTKGKGRTRVKRMIFKSDEFSGEGYEELEKLAKARYEVTALDMVEFFKKTKYDDCFGGIFADLPYANQPSDHGRDPPISDESARMCSKGMWRMAMDHCVVVLGCGSTEQVLFLCLLCFVFCVFFFVLLLLLFFVRTLPFTDRKSSCRERVLVAV